MDALGASPHWFPTRDRSIWGAVALCAQENIPPTPEAVALRCDAAPGYIQTVATGWNEEDGKNVLYHADELKKLGILADLRHLGSELREADEPSGTDGVIEYAMARLSGVAAMQSNRAGDAYSVSESAWKDIEQGAGEGVATGIKWFDELTGGIWPGFNYWVAGAYKSGKTTLMRNIVLNIATAGVACDVFCAEGSREMFALDCIAMLATEIMCKASQKKLRDLRLSGLFLRRGWRSKDGLFSKAELDAINEAREIWNTLNIRVWDTVDGIRNMATLRHRIKQSKFEYGSGVHFLDYSQLFGSRGTLFERQSKTALTAQEIASGEKVALWILTQRNESATGGGDSYSAGVKGGGDASAAADFLLMPMVDQDSEIMFNVKLKHSRHSGLGEGSHIVNRSSGLIVDEWFSGSSIR